MSKNLEETLKKLIAREHFPTQHALIARLQKQGIPVNQSTLSRLLNKIGALKTIDGQGQTYYRLRPQAIKFLADNLVNRIIATETLIIIFTSGGAASYVAEFIDRANLPQIAATLAGDNNIYVAPYHIKEIHEIENILREMFL